MNIEQTAPAQNCALDCGEIKMAFSIKPPCAGEKWQLLHKAELWRLLHMFSFSRAADEKARAAFDKLPAVLWLKELSFDKTAAEEQQ